MYKYIYSFLRGNTFHCMCDFIQHIFTAAFLMFDANKQTSLVYHVFGQTLETSIIVKINVFMGLSKKKKKEKEVNNVDFFFFF